MGRSSNARQKLLDAAFQLIRDNSYGSVGVDQICARAEVNKGSFYHFFKSKAELVGEAYEEHWQSQQPELDKLFSREIAPMERITKWCDWIYRCQKREGGQNGHVCGCPFSGLGVEMSLQDETIRNSIEQCVAGTIKRLESTITEAMREGSLPPGNPANTARHVYSLVSGALIQAKITNSLEGLKELSTPVMRLLGVTGPQPQKRTLIKSGL